jgi:hypothetical protein
MMTVIPETIQANNDQAASQPPAWLQRYPRLERMYRRYERYIGVLVFAVGFIWDTITMVRIDNVIDIVILLFYLAALALMIFFTMRRQSGLTLPNWARVLEPNFVWAMQFAFGGLFSSFVIFYFKSASWTRTQFFFLFLVCLLVGNEFLNHRLKNPKLLATLYTFCLLSFLAFFLPILFASVKPSLFVLAGALSFVISTAVFALGVPRNQGDRSLKMRPIVACILAVCVSLNVLYFAGLIPPVPLALKTGGIFHRVTRTAAGYEVQYARPPVYQFWRQSDNPLYLSQGEPAYCFSAVFAPRGIHIPVHHVWSRYIDPPGWKITDLIAFEISGGREGGYRGYTRKQSITPGKWRVEVETDRGQILGRIDFTVISSPNPRKDLVTRIIP